MSKKTLLISIVACLAWGPLGLATSKVQAATQSAGSSKNSIGIADTQIDHNFIRKVEGSSLKGYVPLVHTTQSGVTIAHGFDLGQPSVKEFDSLPIDKDLKKKLRPYVSLKKYAALSFLKKNPLTITETELHQLNIVAANKILKPLVAYYYKATGRSFLDLPPAAQTVLFSYAYHYGPGFMHKTESKELWQAFVKQDWAKASEQLRQSKLYQSRRISEALLLEGLA